MIPQIVVEMSTNITKNAASSFYIFPRLVFINFYFVYK